MTAKESKAVAWQWRINLQTAGWTLWSNGGEGSAPAVISGDYTLEREHRNLVPESLLHTAEAELGELRRRVGELAADLERTCLTGSPGHVASLRIERLLASDGGADGDNEGERK